MKGYCEWCFDSDKENLYDNGYGLYCDKVCADKAVKRKKKGLPIKNETEDKNQYGSYFANYFNVSGVRDKETTAYGAPRIDFLFV